MGSIPQDDNGWEKPSETHAPAPELSYKSQVQLLLTGNSWELQSHSAGSLDTLADCIGEIPFSPCANFCGTLNYGSGFYSECYQKHPFDVLAPRIPHFNCGRITVTVTGEDDFVAESPGVGVWSFNLGHSPDSRLYTPHTMPSMKAQLRCDVPNNTKELTYRWSSPVPVWNPNRTSGNGDGDNMYLKFVWKTKVY